MYLIADTTHGVRQTRSITIPDKGLNFMDQESFYENLKNLKDDETIITVTNLSFSKKIHKEYGIRK